MTVQYADVIKYDGYPVETHQVTTVDGYVLTALRIPTGIKKKEAKKGPVLLLPGFLMTAASWILVSAERSLPYMLAERGYDVWLATFRGNPLSSGHVKYTQDDIKYWDFRMRRPLHYIDHLLVTYGEKHLSVVNLAPAMYVMNVKGTLWRTLPIVFNQLKSLRQSVSERGSSGKLRGSDHMLKLLVHPFKVRDKISLMVSPLMSELGFEASKPNVTTYIKYTYLVKTCASVKMAIQIMDAGYVGKFSRFDYGGGKNKKLYGSEKPPFYNLGLVRVPSTLTVYSKTDRTTVAQDVKIFNSELPSGSKYRKSLYMVNAPLFTHADFFLHDQVDKLVYNYVIDFLDKEDKLVASSSLPKRMSENKNNTKSKSTIEKASSKYPRKKSEVTPRKASSKQVNKKSEITKGSPKGTKTVTYQKDLRIFQCSGYDVLAVLGGCYSS
ncbi:unnamed protein product [Allacma fusca]|uniref:Partial AB-hydrolase lipase domain-containing protein n=1 Tax=Allacma fusca TaxID=39272 RepID=A0A8J2PRY3_9HEXA|nr:unnamed protein product [Allacma fusca]